MEESTYSTLSDAYFLELRDARPSQRDQATYLKKIEKYRLFLNMLELQQKSRLNDRESVDQQVKELTEKVDAKLIEANTQNASLKSIKSNNAEQIRIQQLIRRRFKSPVSLALEDGSQVSVSLDKSVEELKETERRLKADSVNLEKELAASLAENKARLESITELEELLLQFQTRCQNYVADIDSETRSQEGAMNSQDEAAHDEPDPEHDQDNMSDSYTPPEYTGEDGGEDVGEDGGEDGGDADQVVSI